MKQDFIKNILYSMEQTLSKKEIDQLETALYKHLEGLELIELESKEQFDINYIKLIEQFISAKKIEGCSDKTLKYYNNTLTKLLKAINKDIKLIKTEDLRLYIANYQNSNNPSKTSIDNIRRIMSSFFTWLEEENYIVKSPVRRIHRVKCEKTVKEVINDEQIVHLKDACCNSRDLALIEILSSTGIRVGELVGLNITDINFNERSCIVLGKGNKQREVYFDAKTKIHLNEYLSSRKDSNPALFVSINEPSNRLTISGIEYIVKKIGLKCGIKGVHPHKFRRTLATYAIDKGMPIEQVQKLLGHVKIDTTLHYAMVNQNNVKLSHRRFIS